MFHIEFCKKKNQWAHMSIFLGNDARGLQRLPSLKYYNVQKWESRFSLGLDAAKKGIIWENASIIPIFGSVEHQIEFTFPFQYNIIFETYQSLEPPSSTLEGERHVRSLTFLYRIQFSTFSWCIFWYNMYFCQHRAP